MGVNPVGNVQKYFTFDGESSKTYNTHITGKGAFNAPKRNVELFNIPNRNGAFALDKGSFENIEITYEASIVADTPAEFSQAMSDLRNWLCSRVGYCRLEDDYNPNEYRMAVYKSGLEVEPFLASSGQFEIVFDCKPQRFLKSGETEISVTSGNTITNPTLFDAKPQLQVWGYGEIDMGGQTITVNNEVLGNILLANSGGSSTVTLDMNNMMNGDQFTVSGAENKYWFVGETNYEVAIYNIGTGTNCTANIGYGNELYVYPSSATFVNGTASALNWSVTATVNVSERKGSYNVNTSATFSGSVSYDGDSTVSFSMSVSPASFTHVRHIYNIRKTQEIYGYSTKSVLGNPLYIDLDIGECYNTDSGSPVSVNDAVNMPAELPVLPSGATTITYDNTFTSVKIVPRWWKV